MKQLYGKFEFQAITDDSKIYCTERMFEVGYQEENGEVRFYGSLFRLFGEPLYISEDYENAYEYLIEVYSNSKRKIYLTAYLGASGPVIAADVDSKEAKEAARALMELIQKTEPEDYEYKGYYLDACLKIECGIKHGKIYYREDEMDEDEFEEIN